MSSAYIKRNSPDGSPYTLSLVTSLGGLLALQNALEAYGSPVAQDLQEALSQALKSAGITFP